MFGWNRTHGPSADFSTGHSLVAHFYLAIRVDYDGHGVSVVQCFVQGVLALVNSPFFVLDALSFPRAAQSVTCGSNGKGINDWNVGHEGLLVP